MEDDQDKTQPGAETGRAVAFSDGVLAIIITLLLLELRPPEHESGRLLDGLLRLWPLYLATLTAYLYIAVIWTNHKAVFRRIRWIDRGLHWVNLAVLFTAGLIPFPTAVIADTLAAGSLRDERTAVALYAMVGVALCVSWLGFFHYLSLHPELLEQDVDDEFFPAERTRALVGVVLYALAGLLGWFVSPVVALLIFFVLPIFYGLTSEGLYELSGVRRRQ